DTYAEERLVIKELRETMKHGVRGLAESDDSDFGMFGKIVGAVVNDEARAGASDAALHGERYVNRRECSQENAARDLLGIVHDGSGGLKNFRVECVGWTLAAEESGDVMRRHGRHFGASFDACRAHVRSHDNVRPSQTGVNERFLFKDVEGGAGDFA